MQKPENVNLWYSLDCQFNSKFGKPQIYHILSKNKFLKVELSSCSKLWKLQVPSNTSCMHRISSSTNTTQQKYGKWIWSIPIGRRDTCRIIALSWLKFLMIKDRGCRDRYLTYFNCRCLLKLTFNVSIFWIYICTHTNLNISSFVWNTRTLKAMNYGP